MQIKKVILVITVDFCCFWWKLSAAFIWIRVISFKLSCVCIPLWFLISRVSGQIYLNCNIPFLFRLGLIWGFLDCFFSHWHFLWLVSVYFFWGGRLFLFWVSWFLLFIRPPKVPIDKVFVCFFSHCSSTLNTSLILTNAQKLPPIFTLETILTWGLWFCGFMGFFAAWFA